MPAPDTADRSPRVSVCVITYNHEPFIAQALDSVLDQDFGEPFEVVVAEDCSTDGTAAIVQQYSARFPDRIRPLLRRENLGRQGRNLEDAIGHCRGEYVALLEGDDFWYTRDKLRRQIEFLEHHRDYSACYANTLSTNAAGRVSSVRLRREPDRHFTLEDVLRLKKGSNVAIQTLVFRKEAFSGFPAWARRQRMRDKILAVLLAQRGRLMRFGQPMGVHRYHSGGTWTTLTNVRRRLQLVRHMRNLMRWIGPEHRRLVERELLRMRLRLASTLISSGQVRRGCRMIRSLVRRPGSRRLVVWLQASFEHFWIGARRWAARTMRRLRSPKTESIPRGS